MQLSRKLTEWLRQKETEFLAELSEDDNGKKLIRAGYTLRVSAKAVRMSRQQPAQRPVTEPEWDELLMAMADKPEQAKFLRKVRAAGNDSLPFLHFADLSDGWLNWSTLTYLNSLFRIRRLPFRFTHWPNERRFHWQIRKYRLYPVE